MQEDTYYRTILDHAKRLVDIEQRLGIMYSNFLWTFSGAAIALSITLVSGAFGAKLIEGFCTLTYSWLFLVLCIILTMLSVKTSQLSFEKEVQSIYKEVKEKGEISPREYRGGWVKLTTVLEVLASVALLAGLILMLLFIAQNM
jgi:uncharacterized membrane protein